MGFLTDVQDQIVGLDTALLIYFIEKHPIYHPIVRPFFEALAVGDFIVVTSTITLLETMVHPLRNKQATLAQQYRTILLNSPHIRILDLTPTIAAQAAALRAEYNLRTPDAVQIATALDSGAQTFLTNDRALLKFPPLKIYTLDMIQ